MIELIKNKIDENDWIVVKNILVSLFIKGGALLVSLLTMPAYFRYFNDEKILGVWFTILSMINWVINFDLGIGNGLRNYLVEAIAQDNTKKMKYYISSAYFSIAAMIMILSVLFLGIYKKIDWLNAFAIKDATILKESVLEKTILIVFIGIMIQFLLKLISSVLYALQKAALTSLLGLLSNLIILLYISFAPSKDINTNIINMAYINTLAVNMPLAIATIYLFCTKLKESIPSVKFCKLHYVQAVMKLGVAFFFVQVCYMLLINTDEFIITWISGPEYVVEYQAYNKIFTVLGTVSNLVLIPVWSAITKALNEKNIKWIERLKKKLLMLSALTTFIQFAIVPFTGFLMEVWLQGRIECNYIYSIVFAVFGSLMIWNGVYSSIANGMGRPYVQAVVFVFAIIAKLTGAYLIMQFNLPWIYIMIITSFGLLAYVIIQNNYINKYIRMIKENNQ